MEARGFVLIAKLIALAGDDFAPVGQSIPPPDSRFILFLGAKQDRATLDEAALLDAVAIYTRDLGVTVLRSNDRRRALAETPALAEVSELLRSRNARLAFWCQARADGRSIELVVTDGRRYTIRDAFGQDGPAGSEIYRAIALKVRAALTGPEPPSPTPPASRDSADRGASRPPASRSAPPAADSTREAGPPSGAEDRARLTEAHGSNGPAVQGIGPSSAAGVEAGPPHTLAPTASLTAPPADGTSPQLRHPFFVAVDYALSLPTGAAPWRNAAAVHGVASVRQAAEIDLGFEVAPAAERAVPSGSVTVTDLPLRVGARLVRRTGAYLIAAGALVGVHALFATARAAPPDRATDSTRAVAASFGVEALARGPSVRGFAPEFRFFGEVNAPNTRFRVRGATALEQGALTVGLALGIVLPAP